MTIETIFFQGQGHGTVFQTLMAHNFDLGAMRPFIGEDGRSYISVNTGRKTDKGAPIYEARLQQNATATLRKDEWRAMDSAVIRAARQRLRVWADLRGAGLEYTVPNGMAKTVLEHETSNDNGVAEISMDGLRKGDRARPEYELEGLPLPIIHFDFDFSLRQLMTSRNGNSPLDTTMAERAGRRVAETVENLTLGLTTYKYGGYNVYGYTNHPDRNTYSMTLPTAASWTPGVFIDELLAMKQASHDDRHYGPWRVYNSPNWDQYLDNDYSAAKGDNTLRERAGRIQGLSAPETVDFLTGYQVLLVQQTSDVARAVVGMDITTLQWETEGGLKSNFKVMAIWVPQVRSDQDDRSGIVHGTAA